MASLLGRFARLSFSPAVRAPRNGLQRRFISEQTYAPHLEIDANARGNVLLMIGFVTLPLSIYMVSIFEHKDKMHHVVVLKVQGFGPYTGSVLIPTVSSDIIEVTG